MGCIIALLIVVAVIGCGTAVWWIVLMGVLLWNGGRRRW